MTPERSEDSIKISISIQKNEQKYLDNDYLE
jgi:hypothetical protein